MMLMSKTPGSVAASPAHHRSESRLSIPRRVALRQSSSPLRQPTAIIGENSAYCRETFNEREVSTSASVSAMGFTPQSSGA
jgi:hypothetical protein